MQTIMIGNSVCDISAVHSPTNYIQMCCWFVVCTWWQRQNFLFFFFLTCVPSVCGGINIFVLFARLLFQWKYTNHTADETFLSHARLKIFLRSLFCIIHIHQSICNVILHCDIGYVTPCRNITNQLDAWMRFFVSLNSMLAI